MVNSVVIVIFVIFVLVIVWVFVSSTAIVILLLSILWLIIIPSLGLEIHWCFPSLFFCQLPLLLLCPSFSHPSIHPLELDYANRSHPSSYTVISKHMLLYPYCRVYIFDDASRTRSVSCPLVILWLPQYVNHAHERLCGYTSEELLGRDSTELQKSDRNKDTIESINGRLKKGKVSTIRALAITSGALHWKDIKSNSSGFALGMYSPYYNV